MAAADDDSNDVRTFNVSSKAELCWFINRSFKRAMHLKKYRKQSQQSLVVSWCVAR
eukprot:CAMPEP_0118690822 /NCGR_PEP_ID=MMETSP0800-20121206/10331_1 /TAXON_ID=210618 ORGANISM="Striatella unipunctata, Strain CCMP2910" /NCGR_SAMPLE_ID=MMETSP0800 /ASSEMBLY_ACC=CAM_ASM_000638 /LENGTH=55 /DNA_ID=CAMNT_0006588519 /DNA_START=463 /DNA_END=626 /DNA_ORIENTATION=+